MIEIVKGMYVPEDAMVFKVSRSGGPGGQNINKLNTRVAVLLDVSRCLSLSDTQKHRILTKLASRTDKDGLIRVVCQKHRTQRANRTAAMERLQQLLAEALKVQPMRIETEVPYGAKQRRLTRKRHRSLLKRERGTRDLSGDLGD